MTVATDILGQTQQHLVFDQLGNTELGGVADNDVFGRTCNLLMPLGCLFVTLSNICIEIDIEIDRHGFATQLACQIAKPLYLPSPPDPLTAICAFIDPKLQLNPPLADA